MKRSTSSSSSPAAKKSKKVDKSSELDAEVDGDQKVQDLVEDWVAVFCYKKPNSELLHSALKQLLTQLLGCQLPGKSGHIPKALKKVFPALVTCNSKRDAANSNAELLSMRTESNRDIAL